MAYLNKDHKQHSGEKQPLEMAAGGSVEGSSAVLTPRLTLSVLDMMRKQSLRCEPDSRSHSKTQSVFERQIGHALFLLLL